MTYLLGLTGGIATGKSTVAAVFAQMGYPVIDADQVARAAVAPGTPALADIAQTFGEGVIQGDGSLNRKALGQIVFSDPAQLAKLNAITQPRIRQMLTDQLQQAKASGVPLVVGEVPLLFERDYVDAFDGVLVVTLPEAVQLDRLMARDQIDARAAKQRMASQMPQSQKVAQADFVLDNSLGEAARIATVKAIVGQLV